MTPPPHTLIVNPNDPSAYPSIVRALNAAVDDDCVIIHPGTYNEALLLEKRVTLIGNGPLHQIRLHVTDQTPITINTETYSIENISIHHSGQQECFAIDIAFGAGIIAGCDVSSEGLACISIHGTASPTIQGTRIHNGHETGVMITGQSRAVIDGNMIFGNQYACLLYTSPSPRDRG